MVVDVLLLFLGKVHKYQGAGTVLLGLACLRQSLQVAISDAGQVESLTGGLCVSDSLKALPSSSRASTTPAMLDSSSFLRIRKPCCSSGQQQGLGFRV